MLKKRLDKPNPIRAGGFKDVEPLKAVERVADAARELGAA